MSDMNPCMRCGACCACFPVLISPDDVDDTEQGFVPQEMVVVLENGQSAMKGTVGRTVRCTALTGAVSGSVRCSIYENRPMVCRGFKGAWEKGVDNVHCNQARESYGMYAFER